MNTTSYRNETVTVKVENKKTGKTEYRVVRQLPHDTPVKIGRVLTPGWKIVEVRG